MRILRRTDGKSTVEKRKEKRRRDHLRIEQKRIEEIGRVEWKE